MTGLTLFNSGNVPAHISDAFGDEGNIQQKQSIDQLSYKGKVWRRIVDGEETVLTQVVDGESQPRTTVSLVVLDVNRHRSRSYYAGAYEEGKNAAPDCYSSDGKTPDASVKEPCAKTCDTCPNSVKGSKTSDTGKAITACTVYKRMAVVPSGKAIATHPSMLLRIAQTSMWDKENDANEAAGWYAWDQYTDMLRARGCKHTAQVETKVKFDSRPSHPKLLFKAERWLEADECAAAKKRLREDGDVIGKVLTGGDSDGVMGKPSPKKRPEHQEKPSLPEPEAKPKAEKPTPKKKAAPVVVEEDDSGFEMQAASVKQEPKPKAKAEVVESNDPLADLMNGWDD